MDDAITLLVILLIILLIFLIIYPYSFDLERGYTSVHYLNIQDRQAKVIPVRNPFVIELNEDFRDSSEIELIISSETQFLVCSFWTISPNPLNNFIRKSAEERESAIHFLVQHPNSFCECSCEPSFTYFDELWNRNHVTFHPCCDTMNKEGAYFSIVMIKNEFDQLTNFQLIGMLCVYLITKPPSRLKANLWSRYSIFSNGDISSIQNVFATGPSSSDNEMLLRCSVCMEEKQCQVIIPCRHACTCLNCLLALNMCPVCRGPIQSYFPLISSCELLDNE